LAPGIEPAAAGWAFQAGFERRQHALLVGEPGVGKTCTLRALRKRLPESSYRLTYYHNPSLGRRDFYRLLCLALGLPTRATAAALFHQVNRVWI
jgi:general secretion pathway protein A